MYRNTHPSYGLSPSIIEDSTPALHHLPDNPSTHTRTSMRACVAHSEHQSQNCLAKAPHTYSLRDTRGREQTSSGIPPLPPPSRHSATRPNEASTGEGTRRAVERGVFVAIARTRPHTHTHTCVRVRLWCVVVCAHHRRYTRLADLDRAGGRTHTHLHAHAHQRKLALKSVFKGLRECEEGAA